MLAYASEEISHGGVILTGFERIKANGWRTACRGDPVSCPIHGENRIQGGTTLMTERGVQLVQDGNPS